LATNVFPSAAEADLGFLAEGVLTRVGTRSAVSRSDLFAVGVEARKPIV
jgi:hypothetical protein